MRIQLLQAAAAVVSAAVEAVSVEVDVAAVASAGEYSGTDVVCMAVRIF